MTNLEPPKTIRELTEHDPVNMVLLVREVEVRERKEGGPPYLATVLGDRTGRIEMTVWDDIDALVGIVVAGQPVHVTGKVTTSARYGDEIKVHHLRSVDESEVDWNALLEGPEEPIEDIERNFWALVDGCGPELAEVLRAVFKDDAWENFRIAPAARRQHHAYRHGLIEHTVQVAALTWAAAVVVPSIDTNLAVAGALLHDIGKLDAYTVDALAPDLTDLGKLYGEIPLGFTRIRKVIEQMNKPHMARGLLHIILSHHGSLEHGSPVTPRTREALLVHTMDNLGAKLGMFDGLQKSTKDGQVWSAHHRALGGEMYFAPQATARPEPAPEPEPPRPTMTEIEDNAAALNDDDPPVAVPDPPPDFDEVADGAPVDFEPLEPDFAAPPRGDQDGS